MCLRCVSPARLVASTKSITLVLMQMKHLALQKPGATELMLLSKPCRCLLLSLLLKQKNLVLIVWRQAKLRPWMPQKRPREATHLMQRLYVPRSFSWKETLHKLRLQLAHLEIQLYLRIFPRHRDSATGRFEVSPIRSGICSTTSRLTLLMSNMNKDPHLNAINQSG